jgi:hypothetical protein
MTWALAKDPRMPESRFSVPVALFPGRIETPCAPWVRLTKHDLMRLRGGLLLGASSFEYAFHGVIALVARVLVEWP